MVDDNVNISRRSRSNAWTRLALAACLANIVPGAGGVAQAQPARPEVTVDSGALSGIRDGDIVSFKGVPYAAPPVGGLRWRPPQPIAPWRGVRAADRNGAICEQKDDSKDSGVGPLPMSEDCLTLNVFAPAGANKAPVMVWIHGGGFVNGSGTAALYDGSAFARQGVVLVSINYRLGRFGFFAYPALTRAAKAKGEPVGNYGLMDMIAALRWVRTNIAAFGGDPRQVTIFGESAGGMAVNDLMISPAARGLFERAIVESGLGRTPMDSLAKAEKAGERFAAQVGLPKATVSDLRKLTPKQILNAGIPSIFGGQTAMVDGQIVPMDPISGFAKGLDAKVAYIVGWNSQEVPRQMAPIFMLAIRASEPRITGVEASYPDHQAFMDYIVTDFLFIEPALDLANLHAANGNPTWVYQFGVLSPAAAKKWEGAPHATERMYVFRTLKTSGWPTDANDAAQAKTINAYWVAFAKAGNPNGGDRPLWPPYDRPRDEILDFTNGGPVATHPPRRKGIEAISSLYR